MTDHSIPDQVSACGRCGTLFDVGGGGVVLLPIDDPASVVSATLCPACYQAVYWRVVEYLYSVDGATS